MDQIKLLQEKRAKEAADMQAILELAKKEERGLTDDERVEWDKRTTAYDRLSEDIKRLEKYETLDTSVRNIVADRADVQKMSMDEARAKSSDAFRKLILSRVGLAQFTQEHRDILENNPYKEYRTNAQSTTTTAGGYTIPQAFSNELAIAELAWGGMMQVSRILRTDNGAAMPWPSTNDTGISAYLLTEAGNSETSASDVVFAQAVTLNAYKYTSGMVRVSSEILTDSYFDMTTLLKDLFAMRMGRGLNAAYTTGDGSDDVSGVITGATSGVTIGSDSLTYNNVVDLLHSVDPAYRQNGRFMFNDSTLKYLRKLLDGDSNLPIWQPQISQDVPATILGYPYTVNQDVADIGTGLKSMLFGDFKNYVIRIVNGDVIKVVTELYAGTDQIGIVMFRRTDGHVVDAGTHPIKYVTHA